MKNSHPKQPLPRRSRKERIKSALFFVLYYSGLEWILAHLVQPKSVAVLMYHGVSDQSTLPAHIDFHVKLGDFEQQMRVLKSRYRIAPLSDIVSALSRGEEMRKAIVITFDDGYRNNARHAAPILSRLGIPATVFVATAYIDTNTWIPLNEMYWLWAAGKLNFEETNQLRRQIRGSRWSEVRDTVETVRRRHTAAPTEAAVDTFEMLRWAEVREMAGRGIEFGSHTHSHCNMAVETPDQQRTELQISKQLLESNLQRRMQAFAYPYGHAEHMSEISRDLIIEAGFDCAISAEHGLVTKKSDRFSLPRLGYQQPIWMFAGELLYQFFKQSVKEVLGRS